MAIIKAERVGMVWAEFVPGENTEHQTNLHSDVAPDPDVQDRKDNECQVEPDLIAQDLREIVSLFVYRSSADPLDIAPPCMKGE